MEDWISSLKSVQSREHYEVRNLFPNQHLTDPGERWGLLRDNATGPIQLLVLFGSYKKSVHRLVENPGGCVKCSRNMNMQKRHTLRTPKQQRAHSGTHMYSHRCTLHSEIISIRTVCCVRQALNLIRLSSHLPQHSLMPVFVI